MPEDSSQDKNNTLPQNSLLAEETKVEVTQKIVPVAGNGKLPKVPESCESKQRTKLTPIAEINLLIKELRGTGTTNTEAAKAVIAQFSFLNPNPYLELLSIIHETTTTITDALKRRSASLDKAGSKDDRKHARVVLSQIKNFLQEDIQNANWLFPNQKSKIVETKNQRPEADESKMHRKKQPSVDIKDEIIDISPAEHGSNNYSAQSSPEQGISRVESVYRLRELCAKFKRTCLPLEKKDARLLDSLHRFKSTTEYRYPELVEKLIQKKDKDRLKNLKDAYQQAHKIKKNENSATEAEKVALQNFRTLFKLASASVKDISLDENKPPPAYNEMGDGCDAYRIYRIWKAADIELEKIERARQLRPGIAYTKDEKSRRDAQKNIQSVAKQNRWREKSFEGKHFLGSGWFKDDNRFTPEKRKNLRNLSEPDVTKVQNAYKHFNTTSRDLKLEYLSDPVLEENELKIVSTLMWGMRMALNRILARLGAIKNRLHTFLDDPRSNPAIPTRTDTGYKANELVLQLNFFSRRLANRMEHLSPAVSEVPFIKLPKLKP